MGSGIGSCQWRKWWYRFGRDGGVRRTLLPREHLKLIGNDFQSRSLELQRSSRTTPCPLKDKLDNSVSIYNLRRVLRMRARAARLRSKSSWIRHNFLTPTCCWVSPSTGSAVSEMEITILVSRCWCLSLWGLQWYLSICWACFLLSPVWMCYLSSCGGHSSFNYLHVLGCVGNEQGCFHVLIVVQI